MPWPVMLKKLTEWFYEDLWNLLELTPIKDILFIIGDWNARVGSEEIPRVTGKFGLGVQNVARQSLIEFCQENALVVAHTLFQQCKRTQYNTIYVFTHGHHQMVNTAIRLIISFVAKDWECLYSQQNQDWELTVTQILNSLLPNSDWNWRK